MLAVPELVSFSNTQVARVSFLWGQIEPEDDRFDFEQPDATVRLLNSSGIRPVITVYGSPAWAGDGGPGIQCACDRAADPEWEEVWRRLAERYPGAVFNVWNEPNLVPYGSVQVDRMAELVNLAASAVWDVAPLAKVIGPPASPTGDWAGYMGSLYPKIDPRVGLAANVYPYGHLRQNLKHDLRTIRRIAAGREVWITETNVSRLVVPADRQARYVRAVYELARRHRFKAVIFHRLWSPYDRETNAWDAGLSALGCSGSPLSLYRQIGRLHPGFRPFRAAASVAPDRDDVVAGTPPPSSSTVLPVSVPCPG